MYICYIKGGHFYHDAIDLVSNVVFWSLENSVSIVSILVEKKCDEEEGRDDLSEMSLSKIILLFET